MQGNPRSAREEEGGLALILRSKCRPGEEEEAMKVYRRQWTAGKPITETQGYTITLGFRLRKKKGLLSLSIGE